MLLTGATAVSLYADEDKRVRGVEIERPDGSREDIGCGALVLACNGYGGNPDACRAPHPDDAGRALFRPPRQPW